MRTGVRKRSKENGSLEEGCSRALWHWVMRMKRRGWGRWDICVGWGQFSHSLHQLLSPISPTFSCFSIPHFFWHFFILFYFLPSLSYLTSLHFTSLHLTYFLLHFFFQFCSSTFFFIQKKSHLLSFKYFYKHQIYVYVFKF